MTHIEVEFLPDGQMVVKLIDGTSVYTHETDRLKIVLPDKVSVKKRMGFEPDYEVEYKQY